MGDMADYYNECGERAEIENTPLCPNCGRPVEYRYEHQESYYEIVFYSCPEVD